MRTRVGLCVLLCLWALPVAAQTTCALNCTLTVGQSYSVAADHDGVNTTSYRLILDGAQVGADLPVTALVSGVVTIAGLVAPARGAHLLQVVAFNEDAAAASDPLSVTVKKPPPGKPIKTRVISALLFTVLPATGE